MREPDTDRGRDPEHGAEDAQCQELLAMAGEEIGEVHEVTRRADPDGDEDGELRREEGDPPHRSASIWHERAQHPSERDEGDEPERGLDADEKDPQRVRACSHRVPLRIAPAVPEPVDEEVGEAR